MTTVAWVESPLQLLNAIEWASRDGAEVRIALRADVVALEPVGRWLAGLGASALPHITVVAAASPREAGMHKATRWVLGDAFSGRVRALTAAAGSRRLVLVDDGTATLHLADVLWGRAPFGRMGQRESRAARALGHAMRVRLRRAALAGRLELFTAYGDDVVVASLSDLGVAIGINTYDWARTLSGANKGLGAAHVIIGSALAVDGYLGRADYLAWATAMAAPDAVYLPHRREPDDDLRAIEDAGLKVVRADLPAELVLAGDSRVRAVTSLPSSTAATLARVLPADVDHRVVNVPDEWWTDAADARLRGALSRTVTRSAREAN